MRKKAWQPVRLPEVQTGPVPETNLIEPSTNVNFTPALRFLAGGSGGKMIHESGHR